ncbi:hypothetical protein [Streptomyces sp. NBC_00564]|uniref:hypothetical protein n=1 Tax=Streptomyces sp. NBC_00564 TaxID=2903663 RepID=UPI00352C8209|nr:hypothetical protein OG256_14710 [Streptomyces sp. NBC_00564]
MNLRFSLFLGACLAAMIACVTTAASGVLSLSRPSTDARGARVPEPPYASPGPESVWTAWPSTPSASPGADTSAYRSPEALKGLPAVGPEGLAGMDVRAIMRADPEMEPHADHPLIDSPGQPGIRSPQYMDLSGNSNPELLVAVDTESGHTLLAVYSVRDGKVYPVLTTTGRHVAVHTHGSDLLLHAASEDGAEQVMRFRWDGVRLSTVSDINRYGTPSGATGTPAPTPTHSSESRR